MKFLKKIFHYLMPLLADVFYGFPGKKMIVIGVTGTKGKSTTCRLIASVLESGGYKVGVMSTVEFQIADKRWLNTRKMTMLGRGEIQKMLKQMVLAGCRYAVIETSSEGILQNRHLGVHYDLAVFTNLGTEHSERHGGFDNLKRDKGKLFANLKKEPAKIIAGKNIPKIIIANTDDKQADYFLSFKADEKWGYGMLSANKQNLEIKNIIGKIISKDQQGTEFTVDEQKYNLNLFGDFNVYNALSAIAVGRSQNIPEEKIFQGLKSVEKVEGRMEWLDSGQNFKVVVDYAHEPMSLTELFTSLREIAGAEHKIIGVVGSDGGGRDKGKREKMGEIAGKFCDTVIITDVNCFDEDPKEIAEMLAVGARKTGKKDNVDLFVEIDREKAIRQAFSLAHAGDAVAITAKGTEPCIVVADGKKIPWDDRKVSLELLKEIKNN